MDSPRFTTSTSAGYTVLTKEVRRQLMWEKERKTGEADAADTTPLPVPVPVET